MSCLRLLGALRKQPPRKGSQTGAYNYKLISSQRTEQRPHQTRCPPPEAARTRARIGTAARCLSAGGGGEREGATLHGYHSYRSATVALSMSSVRLGECLHNWAVPRQLQHTRPSTRNAAAQLAWRLEVAPTEFQQTSPRARGPPCPVMTEGKGAAVTRWPASLAAGNQRRSSNSTESQAARSQAHAVCPPKLSQ